ncbi:FtsQ-type POTRA domain-containing protein [Actinomycetospora sp. TBRC 11914]|uniref:cell division protein FtsQ/DivIB n=1 Tax=Actinomycetospora sp. TBRC 11914 TaxID=2729387 RepID=UPI00145CF40E|nr:FtsQ-type POTRA domain-containing protein [Actinomycetospora sp. TBRC 11914]NMO93312.1 FtsQ-type POTRA domain-containing protein [Actinomycetospora sp. TBRC 11914]
MPERSGQGGASRSTRGTAGRGSRGATERRGAERARRRPSNRPPRDRGPRDHAALEARAARRRTVLRRGIAGVVTAGVVAGLVWLLGFSSVFDVTDVEIAGTSPETLPAVRDATRVAPDTSLLWLDTSALDARVQTIPRVATVDVRRSLPHTVTVTVTEREPVAAVPMGTGVALVDATGFAYRTMPAPPTGIPRLVLGPGLAPSPSDPTTVAAVRVLAALPADLRSKVLELRAASPYDVSFTLDGGRTVRWGADADDARKAAVLGPLLGRPGSTYDVSTPDLPVVS